METFQETSRVSVENPWMKKKNDEFFQKALRWTLNGWSAHEIAGFALIIALCSPLVVSGLLKKGKLER